MFIGHFGVAMGAKRVAPAVSLGTLVMAAQLADGLWPIFVLLGVEQVRIDPGITRMTPLDFTYYPWTHSLLADAAWALLFAAVYAVVRRNWQAAAWLGVLVLSHWVLDFVVHRPDLPLWPGGPKVGLGLWNSVPLSMLIELALFGGGAYWYVRATRPRDRLGTVLFAAFIVTLGVLYLAAVFGPPPPSVDAIVVAGLAGWLFVAWGYWIDRHRVPAICV